MYVLYRTYSGYISIAECDISNVGVSLVLYIEIVFRIVQWQKIFYFFFKCLAITFQYEILGLQTPFNMQHFNKHESSSNSIIYVLLFYSIFMKLYRSTKSPFWNHIVPDYPASFHTWELKIGTSCCFPNSSYCPTPTKYVLCQWVYWISRLIR